MQSAELAILDWIQLHCRSGVLDAVLPAISWTCNHGELWIVLALVLLAVKKHRRLGWSVAAALVLDLICCNLVLKPLIGRVRPFAVHPVELLIAPPGDASFPSGHTACSFAAAGAVWFAGYRRAGTAAFALAAVIAFSRLYLYVHWPTDVLGGAVLGWALGWAGARLTERIYAKLEQK